MCEEYINIQTGESLDLKKIELLKDNAMLKVKSELWVTWDFEKNDELGLDIWKITKSASKKAWWICRKCKSNHYSNIRDVYGSRGCPYCAGLKVNYTNSLASLMPDVVKEWHSTKNGDLTPHDVTCGSGKVAWWQCRLGHEWKCKVSERTKSTGCPYCYGRRVWVGFNDINTTSKKLSNWLLNKEDGYKYSKGVKVKLDWKCDCGQIIRNKSPFMVDKDGLGCPNCSDGKSYPEKVIYQLLKQLNVTFAWEKTFTWSQNKRYDFYIENLNTIIEVHGSQHYEEGFEHVGGNSLKEVQWNDEFKYNLALNNKILNYIVIDARKSELQWIKNSVLNSKLTDMFNLENIDWEEIDTLARRKLIIELEELWLKYKSIKFISRKTGLRHSTIKRYLKDIYIQEEDVDYKKPNCEIAIKYHRLNEIVEELKYPVEEYNLDTIIKINEIKDFYIFRKDYFLNNKQIIHNKLHSLNNKRKIYQLDFNYNIVKVWDNSINNIAEELGVASTNLHKHLKGDSGTKTFAKHLWSYEDELEDRIKYFDTVYSTNTKYFICQFDLDGNLIKRYPNECSNEIYNGIELNFKQIKKDKVINGSNYYKGFIFIKNTDYDKIKDKDKFFNEKKEKYIRLNNKTLCCN